ncbi:unnamed protein product [Miscanthus lutarioriparius]|uniref:No apical meristem-associated C-terminal domain-containing protein n=1 Tax=Miscanthus lutarioriparius TaxID=422564 RepID=A0A811N7C6_9POAL|nr:unnamed protein product [Miscanthus lutarioriparius]
MGGKSKRTSAPAPMEIPPQQPLPIPPHGLGTWFPTPPTQSSTSSAPWWHAGHQQLGLAGSMPQGSSWMLPPSVSSQPMAENDDESEVQSWGPNLYPPGGFMSFMNSTASPRGLVSAWLKSSNDPIQSNYKKNDQYWKSVADIYKSTTPKDRARQVKQIKDHFLRIKKRVQWFCGSRKEANTLWASGESDADIEAKAMKSYEEEHKKDGPFTFKHCWEVLRKEPKWEAYLERLEDLEPDKRKFYEEDDVGKCFSLDDDADERPIGGKQAKEQRKKKKKGQPCIIDLEDELNNFLDAQNTSNEGRKEMLETQRRVSSENLEARKLAHLAAKEHKESVMLETYRALLMKETTSMPEDVRSEHVLALKCLREKLFNKND